MATAVLLTTEPFLQCLHTLVFKEGRGWEWRAMAECLLVMCETLGSISNHAKEKNKSGAESC